MGSILTGKHLENYFQFINPFVPNAPFLYPPENIRKPKLFSGINGMKLVT